MTTESAQSAQLAQSAVLGGLGASEVGASEIRLSLAVAAPHVTASDLERYVTSRQAAGVSEKDEVLIAASPASSAGASELERWIEAQSPEPGLTIALHASDTTPMRLWGFAMGSARGQYVAVLDARDSLANDWVGAWAEAVERDAGSIVCGPVDPGNLADSCSWAAYLSEYGRFWTPLSRDDLDEAPGNNIVFPRSALPSADTLQREGFWKTFHLDSLRLGPPRSEQQAVVPGSSDSRDSSDSSLSVSPGMVVQVTRPYRLAVYLHRRYLHGRCYGGRRLEQPGAPPRVLCLGFTPFLPWLRTARVLRRLTSRPRRAWPRAALGPLVLGEIAWSWGEFAGYARGAGTACEELW